MRKVLEAAVLIAALAGIGYAIAQQTTPSELPGCVYNATPPTLSDKQSIVLQCDVNGKIKGAS